MTSMPDDVTDATSQTTLNLTTEERGALLVVSKALNRYVLPVIIVVGIFGNTLSVMVFINSKLRKHSTSVYLATLAVVDSGLLVCLFFMWLGWIGRDVSNTQPLCSIVVYVTYVCSFLSVWIVVSFTVERYIVVSRPLRGRQFLRKRHAHMVVLLLTVIALFLYLVLFWTTGVILFPNGIRVCTTYPKYEYVLWILSHIDTIITLLVPTVIIFILNGLIVCIIYQSTRVFQRDTFHQSNLVQRRDSLVEATGIGHLLTSNLVDLVVHTAAAPVPQRSHSQRGSQYFKTTKMLLVVSSVFLLLNLPSHAFRIQLIIRRMFAPEYVPSFTEFGLQQIAEFIYYVHFAINFCLYSLCGENFRTEVRCLFKKMCRQLTCQSVSASFRRSRNSSCRNHHDNTSEVCHIVMTTNL